MTWINFCEEEEQWDGKKEKKKKITELVDDLTVEKMI
jgi:hypothetical protein